MTENDKGYFVYILRCADDTLYTGSARDAAKRLAQHNSNKGAKYTRGRGPSEMIYLERLRDRSEAQRREAEIKRLSREEKLKLAKSAK